MPKFTEKASKAAAFDAANLFAPVPGGVLMPYNLSDPAGPNTVMPMRDDHAPRVAREMRARHALTLMGYDEHDAERAVEHVAQDGRGSAREIFNFALSNLRAKA